MWSGDRRGGQGREGEGAVGKKQEGIGHYKVNMELESPLSPHTDIICSTKHT